MNDRSRRRLFAVLLLVSGLCGVTDRSEGGQDDRARVDSGHDLATVTIEIADLTLEHVRRLMTMLEDMRAWAPRQGIQPLDDRLLIVIRAPVAPMVHRIRDVMERSVLHSERDGAESARRTLVINARTLVRDAEGAPGGAELLRTEFVAHDLGLEVWEDGDLLFVRGDEGAIDTVIAVRDRLLRRAVPRRDLTVTTTVVYDVRDLLRGADGAMREARTPVLERMLHAHVVEVVRDEGDERDERDAMTWSAQWLNGNLIVTADRPAHDALERRLTEMREIVARPGLLEARRHELRAELERIDVEWPTAQRRADRLRRDLELVEPVDSGNP